MLTNEKVIYLFNKFYSSFLKDLKESHEDLRSLVKQHYKVIDKKSHEYVERFVSSFQHHVRDILEDRWSACEDQEVCKGISMKMALSLMSDKNKVVFWNYMYTLLVFAHMVQLTDDSANEALYEQVVKILGQIQNHDSAVEEDIKDILEDEVRELLSRARETSVAMQPEASGGDSFPDIFAGMQNSKIASLAKEISKDIDISSLPNDNPQEMIKNLLDFSGSNNVLGNIIQKVSSTLGQKMSSGELKQEELLSEAMSMMSLMNAGNNPLMAQFANNPMFSHMMKNFAAGRAAPRPDVGRKSATRDRLRQKLEERKKNMES